MHDARVLVVDDSAAMRALFSDILEQAKGVKVVGTATDAADARAQIPDLNPNVLTLDVEMPGMSGIDFLQEIMTERPMPVVMLSSLTQAGTETSLKALGIGAVECFPKPLKVSPEQFAKAVSKLGKIVHAAANANARPRARSAAAPVGIAHQAFAWNGRYVAACASAGGIEALTSLFPYFPANCPPTVLALQAEPALVDAFIAKIRREHDFAIQLAVDGAALVPGTVHIACDPALHVVVERGEPARLRLVARDPVDGARPSGTLLFGSLARTGLPAAGVVLSGLGEDGAKGLLMLRNAGGFTLAEDRATATFAEASAAAIAAGAVDRELNVANLADALIAKCNAHAPDGT